MASLVGRYTSQGSEERLQSQGRIHCTILSGYLHFLHPLYEQKRGNPMTGCLLLHNTNSTSILTLGIPNEFMPLIPSNVQISQKKPQPITVLGSSTSLGLKYRLQTAPT